MSGSPSEPPNQPSVPPDSELLRQYLSGNDTSCPVCHYNLRGLTGDVCPECGKQFRLMVGPVKPHFGYLVLLIGALLTSVLDLAYPPMMLLLNGPQVARFMLDRNTVVCTGLAAIEVAAALLIYNRRCWFLRQRRSAQLGMAVGAWAINLALLGWALKV